MDKQNRIEIDGLQIEPTKLDDKDFFIFTHHKAYKEVVAIQFGWDEEAQDGFAEQTFNGGNMNIIFKDNIKVGVVGFENFADYLWLKEVFVLPEFQNQKIGSKIVKYAIDESFKQQKPLRLQVLKMNVRAKDLYERMGLTVENETDTHWKLVFNPKEL
ncbi:MAG: GNAT family N-acetyltransferase [Proteobacteria bacterium]|nr:GNAT family N-acetyltransferase [Pseudomonadota bacterium]